MGLSDRIRNENLQAGIAADCSQLIDEHVATKNGLSGLALKAVYATIKGVGPGYIPNALQRLLPSAVDAIEPIWSEGLQSGDPVEHIRQNRDRAAEMLLSVTDAKIHKADGIVRTSYNKLRQSVKRDVEEVVPALAKILDKHVRVSVGID
jgi:hypothetical protein